MHQFQLIVNLLGTPDDELLKSVTSENTIRFVRSLPRAEKKDFRSVFTTADKDALDLLQRMLVFDVSFCYYFEDL